MGMFDDVKGKAEGMLGQSGSHNPAIMTAIMHMLSDRSGGGLHGIIQSFTQNGLGDIVSSWIGKGENRPISPTQVKEGLGDGRIQQVASQAGVSNDEAASQISQHLPGMVDKLTPDGTVPEGGMLEKGLEFMKSRL